MHYFYFPHKRNVRISYTQDVVYELYFHYFQLNHKAMHVYLFPPQTLGLWGCHCCCHLKYKCYFRSRISIPFWRKYFGSFQTTYLAGTFLIKWGWQITSVWGIGNSFSTKKTLHFPPLVPIPQFSTLVLHHIWGRETMLFLHRNRHPSNFQLHISLKKEWLTWFDSTGSWE